MQNYSLIDSGAGLKLERFGARTICRPSSLALWQQGKATAVWKQADAAYDPENGWKFRGKPFENWIFECAGLSFELRLQKNGQVGVFPDHIEYLRELEQTCAELRSKEAPQALNLFAYTGLASLVMAKAGAEVCHIDLSEQCLTWAKRNQGLNPQLSQSKLRLIPEDAFKFAARELKRGVQYDIVVADPPSFGRLSKTKSWKLEDLVHDFLQTCAKLLKPSSHALYLTCHHAALGPEVLSNLVRDHFPQDSISARSLGLPEADTRRILPAGHLVVSRR